MKYLLDTHVFIYWVDQKFRPKEIESMDRAANDLAVSTAIFWEMAYLQRKGELLFKSWSDLKLFSTQVILESRIHFLAPTPEDMIDSVSLEDLHKDPFDRLFVTQSQNNALILITNDALVPQYSVNTMTTEHFFQSLVN